MKRIATTVLIVSMLGMCLLVPHSPAIDAEVNPNSSSSNSDDLQTTEVEVLFFYAEWCGPCRQMMPEIEHFRKQYPNLRVVNVDEDRKTMKKFHVVAVPTFLSVQRGKAVRRAVGSMSREALGEFLENPVESDEDR